MRQGKAACSEAKYKGINDILVDFLYDFHYDSLKINRSIMCNCNDNTKIHLNNKIIVPIMH
jgi:hypothetical protein